MSTAVVAPSDLDAEEAVLGALMLVDAVDAVVAESHLAPEHFYRKRHALIFEAVLALSDRGVAVDALSVTNELTQRRHLGDAGGKEFVSSLASLVPVAGNVLHYAGIVVREAQWRRRLEAGHLISEGAKVRDQEKITHGEELLREDIVRANSDYDTARLTDVAHSLMEGLAPAEFPYPWQRLNRLVHGGMRRGQFIVLSGYSNFGKSQIVDQILDNVQKQGKRACLYMNEMGVDERVARRLTRWTGISEDRISSGDLGHKEFNQISTAVDEGALGWSIVDVAGWSPEEVCHHIRRSRFDFVAVDLLNRFEWREESELSSIITRFDQTAKLANCALVLVSQVNERVAGHARSSGKAVYAHPVSSDLKGSGDIKNHADHVLFVHRDQDDKTAAPLEDGQIYFSKVRRGKTGGIDVRFDEKHLSFRGVDYRDRQDEPRAEHWDFT